MQSSLPHTPPLLRLHAFRHQGVSMRLGLAISQLTRGEEGVWNQSFFFFVFLAFAKLAGVNTKDQPQRSCKTCWPSVWKTSRCCLKILGCKHHCFHPLSAQLCLESWLKTAGVFRRSGLFLRTFGRTRRMIYLIYLFMFWVKSTWFIYSIATSCSISICLKIINHFFVCFWHSQEGALPADQLVERIEAALAVKKWWWSHHIRCKLYCATMYALDCHLQPTDCGIKKKRFGNDHQKWCCIYCNPESCSNIVAKLCLISWILWKWNLRKLSSGQFSTLWICS